jgi:hypothetical protein
MHTISFASLDPSLALIPRRPTRWNREREGRIIKSSEMEGEDVWLNFAFLLWTDSWVVEDACPAGRPQALFFYCTIEISQLLNP